MSEQLVECPECGHKFALANILRHSIEDEVRKDLEGKYAEKERGLTAGFTKKEKDLTRREKDLKEAEETIEKQVTVRLKAEREKLREKAREEAEEELSNKFDEQGKKLERIQAKLKEAQEKESEVRKLKEEAEEKIQEADLSLQRKLEEERVKVREKVSVEESEKWQAKIKLKEEELDRVNKALERAQRAGTSGELAGEVAEKTLEERLRSTFTEDQIDPITRGKEGADVLQTLGKGGSILWESKDRYPNWNKEWIPKLKRDRNEAKASVAILVTTIGPDGKSLRGPTHEDGIVITPPWTVIGVASMLRPHLMELARQRRLYDKQETLQAAVYAWVTSQDFQRGVATILENLRSMEQRVSRAKVNVTKWFRHMGEDVDLTMRSVAEFYGSAQSHARLPDLPALALNPGDGDKIESKEDNDETNDSS